jgi:hypothetical protein
MANYVLSNNTTISFPEIKVLKDYNDSSFEEIKAIVSNYKSPIGFGKDYPELMKIIFNNKWFNDLFPNYTKIEDIIKLTIETKTRDNCMSNLKSYYRLLKILGDEIMDIIFGEAHTHQYYNIHSDYIMHKIRSKYSNKAELYVNNRSLYKRLVKEDLLYVYYPNDKHNVEYWDE